MTSAIHPGATPGDDRNDPGAGGTGSDGLDASARALLDAVVAMSSDLDTHSVLRHIVESACRLTDAEYGALGVLRADRQLSDFVTHGLDQEAVRRIGDPPTGKGILALTLQGPLRLDDLGSHPESVGFPEHHPPMRTLLGVPIRIRGATFGNLYVAEKGGGRPFSHRDELLLEAVATVAGVVIENSHAFRLSERRRRWLEMYGELSELLLPPITLPQAFHRIAAAIYRASSAETVAVAQIPVDGPPRLAATAGTELDLTREEIDVFVEASRLVVSSGDPRTVPLRGTMLAIVVPLRAHLTAPGVIVGIYPQSLRADETEEREMLSTFAEQAGLALDRAQALEDRAEMAVVSDRDRIARDLHDVVIQRLFAAALYMQTTKSLATEPALVERLDQSVKDLDQTIRDIRATIFELQARPQASLRNEVRDLVRDYVPVLGFTPSVELVGPVDTPVEAKLQQQLVAVLREGLSNVARHAGATSAAIDVQVTDTHLRVRVTDDGRGLGEQRKDGGLGHARRKAELLGGSVDLWSNDPNGVVLVWQVPLAD